MQTASAIMRSSALITGGVGAVIAHGDQRVVGCRGRLILSGS
jgi:hypothetical protein